MKVSIVVCAYNEEQYLEQSLQSLLELDYDRKKYEIIVVDDDSNDKTPAIASRFANEYPELITYKRIAHGGLSFARNIGVCLAQYELIAFIDGDALAHKDWLTQLTSAFKDPNVMVAGGLVENLNADNAFASFLHHVHYLPPQKGEVQLHDVIGTCMVYRRSYFEIRGGFYYFFDRRGDETTVNQILHDKFDYKIVHEAIVYHERPIDAKSYFKMTTQNGYYGYFSAFVVKSVLTKKVPDHFGGKFMVNRALNLLFYPALIVLALYPGLESLTVATLPLLAFLKRHVISGTIFDQIRRIWSYDKGNKVLNLIRGLYVYLTGIFYSDIGFLKAYLQGTKGFDFNNSIDNCK